MVPKYMTVEALDKLEGAICKLYGSEALVFQKQRYQNLIKSMQESFGVGSKIAIFSAPGRTEIGGNHTDHQRGCVLAGSINLDMIAAVTPRDDTLICVQSEGYPQITIDSSDLGMREEEKNTSSAIIRGIAAWFSEHGCILEGFNACIMSSVPKGSGLSSSAAFEVLIANIFNSLFYDNQCDTVQLAQIGQWAENVYFGKPCGLMDQTASSVGGMVSIDFEKPNAPVVKKLSYDFSAVGFALCIIDCRADHADLTDEYAAIPQELKQLCACFGKSALREIPENVFFQAIPELRGQVSDRAILRAIHFYQENSRAQKQAQALRNRDLDAFLRLVQESGRSSWMYLQNITPAGAIEHQDMAVALALCDKLLGGRGAFRVHGGGFAGTVQTFVPVYLLDQFQHGIEAVFGAGSCHLMSIRSVGGIRLL